MVVAPDFESDDGLKGDDHGCLPETTLTPDICPCSSHCFLPILVVFVSVHRPNRHVHHGGCSFHDKATTTAPFPSSNSLSQPSPPVSDDLAWPLLSTPKKLCWPELPIQACGGRKARVLGEIRCPGLPAQRNRPYAPGRGTPHVMDQRGGSRLTKRGENACLSMYHAWGDCRFLYGEVLENPCEAGRPSSSSPSSQLLSPFSLDRPRPCAGLADYCN